MSFMLTSTQTHLLTCTHISHWHKAWIFTDKCKNVRLEVRTHTHTRAHREKIHSYTLEISNWITNRAVRGGKSNPASLTSSKSAFNEKYVQISCKDCLKQQLDNALNSLSLAVNEDDLHTDTSSLSHFSHMIHVLPRWQNATEEKVPLRLNIR